MHISIDTQKAAGPFQRFWRATGFSPGQLLLLPHMRAALAMVAATPDKGVEYLRPHYLFELIRAQRSGASISYDWSLFDRAVDTMVEFGYKPFFELMGNPSQVFTGFTERDDVLVWRDFIATVIARLKTRYGAEELAQWYFETWNEPDLPWWQHGERGFLNYYDACVAGIDAVDPSLKIGGPGTAIHMSPLFKAFVAHCDSGVSAITGETPRLDFISVHEKGGTHHPEDITPDSLGISRRELAVARYIGEHHPRLATVPLVNNECDPQVGWWDIHTWNATPYVAAIMAKIVDQHQRVLIDDAQVPYAMLASDNAFIGTWGQRTQLAIFAERKFDKGQTEFKTDAGEL
ncbi:MAG: glycosyl hydrolase, partial [Devosia sp.]|nr:glycosyl hydrolase [Devosia sp.]